MPPASHNQALELAVRQVNSPEPCGCQSSWPRRPSPRIPPPSQRLHRHMQGPGAPTIIMPDHSHAHIMNGGTRPTWVWQLWCRASCKAPHFEDKEADGGTHRSCTHHVRAPPDPTYTLQALWPSCLPSPNALHDAPPGSRAPWQGLGAGCPGPGSTPLAACQPPLGPPWSPSLNSQ